MLDSFSTALSLFNFIDAEVSVFADLIDYLRWTFPKTVSEIEKEVLVNGFLRIIDLDL